MKLVLKLTLALILGISVVLATNGYFRVRREVALFESSRVRDHELVGLALSAAFAAVWRAEGEAHARAMLEQASAREDKIAVQWVAAAPFAGDPGAPVTRLASEAGLRQTYVPIASGGTAPRPPGGLLISEPLAVERSYVRTTVIDTWLTTALLAVVSAAISAALGAWLVGRPVHSLADKARRVGQGDFAGPLVLRQRDELGELAREMNAMCERLVEAHQRSAAEAAARIRALEQLRHADRLMTVGKLASGIAHELGTPLNVVGARAGMIADGETTPTESADYARIIVRACDQMTRIIRQLLDFARPRGPVRATEDVRRIAQLTLTLLEPIAAKKGVALVLEADEAPATAELDAGQIQQVFTNLVVNAVQAMEGPGTVLVSVACERAAAPPATGGGAERACICVRVRDQGPGIAGRAPGAHLRALLHHQGRGRGDRPRPLGGLRHRPRAPGVDGRAEHRRRGQRAHRLPAGGGGGMTPRVLLVDDDPSLCETLEAGLARRGFTVVWRTSAAEALATLATLGAEDFDVVVTDLNMKGLGGLELCERVVERRVDLPVVVLTAFGSFETAVQAIRAGAYDFISKPVQLDVLAIALRRAAQHRALHAEVKRLRLEVGHPSRTEGFIGQTPAMQRVHDLIAQVADAEASVLITGESGTGKEVVARALHRQSRREGAFVAVNCAAMPEALLESELFGHVRGAFTDAREARPGLFVEARRGTLFLDEIGDMPLGLQPKLLRVLQERTVRPLGGTGEIPVDVRILAATNKDLESAIDEKRFREDLFFRINVIQIPLPPLRARAGDILPLAAHFLAQIAARAGKSVTGISPPAAAKLLAYAWPGNVRELINCVERAVALTRHEQIVVDDLPDRVLHHTSSQLVFGSDDPSELLPMDEVEKRYILRVLEAVAGNKTAAARILGFERKTLYRKLAHFGVDMSKGE